MPNPEALALGQGSNGKHGDDHPKTDPLTSRLPTGWAAVEKALTEYDREDIGNYKEDMDTLLVFTGLYSAVLAAFVVVSYTMLQENTATESLKALRIIVNQTAGYTILNEQLINSTAILPPSSPPFQPSAAAIRINMLWFASLVTSLSTASFAILVKQWLREYTAFASSSPQGQLRIREFRRKGLDAWKVFGIASALPLLLQVALALFFVGLCFFTAEAHPAVGNTTLPLVCAWAFFYVAFTLSPIFSARCPYKTPALSFLTRAIRTRLWLQFSTIAMPWVCRILVGLVRLVLSTFIALTAGLFLLVVGFLEMILAGKRHEAPPRSLDSVNGILDKIYNSDWTPLLEEAAVLKDRSNDLTILASADALQANVELDLATMKYALEQSKPKWDEAIKFLVQVIGNRAPLPAAFSAGPKGPLVDIELLSSNTQTAIAALFDEYVVSKLSGDPTYKIPPTATDAVAGAWATYIWFSLRPSCDDIPPKALILCFNQWLVHAASADAISEFPLVPVVFHRMIEDCGEAKLPEIIKLLRRILNQPGLAGTTPDPALGALLDTTTRRLSRRLEAFLKDPARSHSWTDPHTTTVSLTFDLCRAAYQYGHPLNCEELVAGLFTALLSSRLQKGMQASLLAWISQPSGFVYRHTLVWTRCLVNRPTADYYFIASAIKEIARPAGMQNHSPALLLNLGLITLWIMRLERTAQQLRGKTSETSTSLEEQEYKRSLAEESHPTFPEVVYLPNPRTSTSTSYPPLNPDRSPSRTSNTTHWRQVFLFLASALRSTSVRGNFTAIASACWSEVDSALPAIEYPPHHNDKRAEIPDYFCLMLSKYHVHHGGWQARRIRLKSNQEEYMIKADGENEIGRRISGTCALPAHGWTHTRSL